MKIEEKLWHIQQNLKAPKGQYNKFGDFHYRSCEDIQEAVKPLPTRQQAKPKPPLMYLTQQRLRPKQTWTHLTQQH